MGHAIRVNDGNVLITQSEFKQPEAHVYLGRNANSLKSLNSGYNRVLKVDDNSVNALVERLVDDTYLFEPIPKDIKTDIDVQPRPKSNKVMRVELSKAQGFNANEPVKDVSAALQEAMNEMNALGRYGLPAGR